MADQSKLIKELNDKIEELRGDPNNSPLRDFSSRKARTKPKLAIKNRKVLKGHFAKIYAISWSSTKKLVSASQDGKMIIWDAMSTNKIMAVPLKSSWVMTCSFSPNEKMLGSGGLDNTCSIFSVDYNNPSSKIHVRELNGHEGYISSIKFLDDDRIISSSGDSTCRLWDIKTKKTITVYDEHESDVMSVAIKKSSNIFVTGSCDANSKIFDVRAGKNSVATFAGHESDINSVCFFNDINCIGTGSDDSSCRLFDMRSMQQLNRYVSDNILCGITSVVPSRGGKYLFAGYDDYNVYAWDVLSGEPAMTTTAHENRVSCIDINRDGLALATGSWDTFVKIWA